MAAPTAGGVLADFSRKPLQYKVLVFAAIGLVLVGLYWQLVLSGVRDDAAQAEADNKSMLDEKTQLSKKVEDVGKLSARAAELKKMIENNEKALPTEAELPAFFETLNRKVGEAGVEVVNWDYKKDIYVESGERVFVKVPVEITLTGSFYQIKRFFRKLVGDDEEAKAAGLQTEKERIVTVENLELSDPEVKNNDIVLTAKFTAATFRQGTPEEDDAKEAARDKPLTAPAEDKPTKGLPGVKAKVQGSVDKSEQRVEDKTGDEADVDRVKEGM